MPRLLPGCSSRRCYYYGYPAYPPYSGSSVVGAAYTQQEFTVPAQAASGTAAAGAPAAALPAGYEYAVEPSADYYQTYPYPYPYSYYPPYAGYPAYYGYGYPPVSFSFGYWGGSGCCWGRWHGGGWHGHGWHGGGGGWHGGSSWQGGGGGWHRGAATGIEAARLAGIASNETKETKRGLFSPARYITATFSPSVRLRTQAWRERALAHFPFRTMTWRISLDNWHESGYVSRLFAAVQRRRRCGLSVLGGSDMMAFVFFLLWMLASLGLLTIWVFRQTPVASHEEPASCVIAES
ncbi:Zinc resistance-associated protein [Candidatus Paraburkholderia schumanniana]|nr:Zinc resistance-associated protein [Candidatus Paraburkholderia schumannianae]